MLYRRRETVARYTKLDKYAARLRISPLEMPHYRQIKRYNSFKSRWYHHLSIYVVSNDRFHEISRMRETERGKRKRIVSRWSHGVNVARMILSLNPLPPLARMQGEWERGKEKEVVNAGSIGFTTPLFSCISRMTTCYTLHTANY